MPNIINGDRYDNLLIGTAGDDAIYGFEGNDTLRGGPGDDLLDGGGGDRPGQWYIDTADYSDATSGVTVSLAITTAQAVGGGLGSDTLVGIEKLIGSPYDDTLTGYDLEGGAGDDLLIGTSGDDILVGGDGNDTLRGGDGSDTLSGGPGDDVLDGGDGIDFVSSSLNMATGATGGASGSDTLISIEGTSGCALDFSAFSSAIHLSVLDETGTATIDSGTFFNNASTFYLKNVRVISVTGGSGNDSVSYADSRSGEDSWHHAPDWTGYCSIQGGDGNDTLSAYSSAGALSGTISGGNGDDWLSGLGTSLTLDGGPGNDHLHRYGTGLPLLVGSGTKMTLLGGDGDDVIEVDSVFFDNDTTSVDGGAGYDELSVNQGVYILPHGPNGARFVVGSSQTTALQCVSFRNIECLHLSGSRGLGDLTFVEPSNPTPSDRCSTFADMALLVADMSAVSVAVKSQSSAANTWAVKCLVNGQWQDVLTATGIGSMRVIGGSANDTLSGGDTADLLVGGAGNDTLDGGSNVDTAAFSGNSWAYTITQAPTGQFTVSGLDGADTLTNVEYAKFDNQTIRLLPGSGTTVNFAADPSTYMGAIRDFDGNDLGGASSWKLIGTADVNGDGRAEHILVNRQIGRWAEIGTEADGLTYFSNYNWAGDTRVVGIYIDPLVADGTVVKDSATDSQRRFQNDLNIENIHGILGQGDYNHDGLQEVYFSLTDGTAYLHAYMHADGNIQYANYQSKQQVIDYLTANGFSSSTWSNWFPASQTAMNAVSSDPLMSIDTVGSSWTLATGTGG